MTLSDIRDWLKPLVADLYGCYVGKIDSTKDKVIGVYGRQSNDGKVAIGGLKNTSTWPKKISILVHWNKNAVETEKAAQGIYNIFNNTQAIIGGRECFFVMEFDGPVPIGTDDNDIFEYTLELTIIYKRG